MSRRPPGLGWEGCRSVGGCTEWWGWGWNSRWAHNPFDSCIPLDHAVRTRCRAKPLELSPQPYNSRHSSGSQGGVVTVSTSVPRLCPGDVSSDCPGLGGPWTRDGCEAPCPPQAVGGSFCLGCHSCLRDPRLILHASLCVCLPRCLSPAGPFGSKIQRKPPCCHL